MEFWHLGKASFYRRKRRCCSELMHPAHIQHIDLQASSTQENCRSNWDMQPFAVCDRNKKWDPALYPGFSCLSQGWIHRGCAQLQPPQIFFDRKLDCYTKANSLGMTHPLSLMIKPELYSIDVQRPVDKQKETQMQKKNPIKIAFGRRYHSLWRKMKRRELCVEIKQGIHSYADVSRVRISQKNPAILNGNGSDQRQLHSST